MTQPYRLATGLIDRSRTLSFTWNGKTLQGHPGDTLASALLANGERSGGAESFKYHRPRGIFDRRTAKSPTRWCTVAQRRRAGPSRTSGRPRLRN